MRVTAVLCVITMLLTLSSCSGTATEAPPALDEPVSVTFDTAKAKYSDVATYEVYEGCVVPVTVPAYFERDGKLLHASVAVGDTVNAGDTLMTLDIEDNEKAVAKLRRDMEGVQRNFEFALARIQFDRESLVIKRDMARKLGDTDAVRALDIDIEAADLSAKQLREVFDFDAANNQRQLDYLLEQQQGHVLTAPISGMVLYVDVQQKGADIKAYSNVVYIADSTQLRVQVLSDRSNIGQIADNVRAKIGDKFYNLSLIEMPTSEVLRYFLSDKPIPSTYIIEEIDGDIESGQYAHVVITKSSKPDCLTIPINALYTGNPSYVYVMENGQRVYRAVEVGVRSLTAAEITDGLSEGEEVFVKQ